MNKNQKTFNRSAFWDGFFFVFGFTSNPFLEKAKELKRKTVSDRIGDSLETTSGTFIEVYKREMTCIHE